MRVRLNFLFAALALAVTPALARDDMGDPAEKLRIRSEAAVLRVDGRFSPAVNPPSPESVLAMLRAETGAELEETSRQRGRLTEARRFVQIADGLEIVGTGAVLRLSGDEVTGFDARIARIDELRKALAAPPPIRRSALRSGHGANVAPAREVLLVTDDGVIRALELRIEESPLKEALHYYDADGSLVLRIPLWFHSSREVSIFRSNPVTKLNNAELRDENDAAAAVPAAAYEENSLEIDEASSSLATSRVAIADLDAPATLGVDPASPDLIFDRSDPRFEEVMAVWHIDRSLAYLESLGYTGTNQIVNTSITVDAHGGNGSDNSFYTKRTTGPVLVFGDGGVDDAEDPDIIYHELGHAIHDGIAPSILFGTSASDARAISEGFSDYWAFSEGLAESVSNGRDPACIGDWDARCGLGASSGCSYPADADCLRRTDASVVLDELDRSGHAGTEHQNGRLWSSTLRELFLGLSRLHGENEGKRRADMLVLEGMVGIPFMPTLQNAADGLIDADDAMYDGATRIMLCGALLSRGVEVSRCHRPWKGAHTVFPAAGTLMPGTGSIRSTHWVPLRGSVRDTRVSIRLDHPDLRDLEISIIAPDDTRVLLARRGSLSGSSLVRTFGLDIPSSEPLGSLDGHELQGEWTLLIHSESSQTGILHGWNLAFATHQGQAPVSRRESGPRIALIPAAGHSPGANSTHWITDLTLRNLTNSPQHIFLILTPAGTNGDESAMITRLFIEPAQTLTLRDVAKTIFGFEGACSLDIRGPQNVLTATSRTYNDSPLGTFGQSIPTYRAPTLGSADPVLFIPGLRETLEFRSNVGFTETSGQPVTMTLEVVGADGDLLGTMSLSFRPWEHRQVSTRGLANEYEAGMARLRYESGEGSLAAYASIIDNRTGDPIYLPAARAEATDSKIIPVVAHLDGAGGSKWRSDLYLSNPLDEPLELSIRYRGVSGAVSGRVEGTLGPYSSAFVMDVVESWFGASGGGHLEITPGSAIVSSRTWNDRGNGSFGQNVASVATGDGITELGQSGVAIGVEQSDHFRTNVGLVEIGDGFAVFDVTVFGERGAMLCTARFGLAPREQRQVSLPSMGCRTTPGGYVVLTKVSGDGSVVGWASVVDNLSGDPVFMPITGRDTP
ncbi:MAG: M36 family metallopeptidase [Acidobacteria bacterium]|nr:M36 family metallopeptidase [Acidobacteriota bacterium]